MKKWIFSVVTATAIGVVSTSHASTAIDESQLANELFGVPAPASLTQLDEQSMQETHGQLAPLAAVIGIVSLDLALSAMFWGVYVPMYAQQGPSFRHVVYPY
ncbi:hypothetical protein NOR51B_2121 [Luminiphilus syltensis NOR5-1B]|uniref:Uncharacterized protein n=1 Tax=Luminiphilus syltensis NOR5-1B TaxID=565045 RepID=B8KXK9_9GAMM|nr:hypothetical protein [Luminiphilus syltensis]EED36173.1 hypothetical protein NOR51B_2121 [Luminiphilus syltensis NOR5-1B]